MIGEFHFLRPWWFAALPLALAVVWLAKRSTDPHAMWKGIVADHLLPFLVQGAGGKSARGPFLLMGAGLAFASVILAGPSWRKEKSPFADDAAAIAVVIQVSPSMKTEDIAPDRLTRSIQKVHDLLARRPGSKASLIAYAGTAHLVMPPTIDGAIIDTFAASLDPSIMPSDGDAAAGALAMADKTLAGAGGGSILWIVSDVADDQIEPIRHWRKSSAASVKILAPMADAAPLQRAADAAHAGIIRLTPDDTDVSALERAAKSAPISSAGESGGRWRDEGYALTPLLLVLLLPFFRRGWMPPLAARA